MTVAYCFIVLEIPDVTKPFDRCLLVDDHKGFSNLYVHVQALYIPAIIL